MCTKANPQDGVYVPLLPSPFISLTAAYIQTSPPLAYFTTHLPKLLGSGFPLSILGFVIDRQIRIFLLPCLVFVGLMSFLAHKEWRFIVYVVPMFSVAAARGGVWM
jgi:alpha-1,6-mannosyltransferase